MLSMTVAANADSPSSAIQMLDVNLVQRDAVGARNGCWADAPMDARVKCAPLEPEHGYLSVVVTVGATSSTDIVVAYESMDLTATGGTDYVALDGSLTIAPGELTGSFRVDFIDDLVEEGNEEFVVKITPPEDVDIAHDYLHVTIIDEESIKITVSDSSEDEGHPQGIFVDATFSQPISWPFSIGIGTAAGTAGPSDYLESDDSISISLDPRPFSSSGFDYRHPLRDDSLDEPDETFTLFIEGHLYLSMEAGSATMTIRDNDDPPSVSVADASGLEDSVGKLSFDVTLDAASAKEITLYYATADDTATAGSDYTQTNETLTFSAGEITKTIDVPVLEDGSPEEDETFTVTLSDAVNATIGDGTGTGTIQDDDPVPTALSIEDVEGLESSDALEFPVTLTGDREAGTTITVDYATSDGTGTAGSDYTEISATLTFVTDVTRQTIRVPLLDDETDEPDETFVVTLSNSSGAMLDDSEATGTIRDNDATPTLSTLTTTPARVLEDGGATAVAVTATLDGARTEATDVAVAVTGSGNADAVDFQNVPSFTITIAAGDKSGTNTFTLTPIDDEVDESDETLTVNGTSIVTVNGTSIATVIVTQVELVDDDATSLSIALTAEPPRVSEGDGATEVGVTATLDASARTEVIEVTVSVAGTGNADAVGFQDVPSFTITIAAGDRSGTATFTLTPIDDNVDESDETLSVTGTSVLPVTGTQVELADDEATSSSISLTAEPPRVSEGDGATAVGVTATLDAGARTEETTVTVTVSGSGDADAVDFADVADFTITISAGDRSGTGNFTLTPEDDNVDESEETLNVGGSSDLPVTADTVALADDDQPSAAILLSASPGRIAEDGGVAPIQVTATLDASARTVATTVSVSVAGSGNPDAVDYAATPTSFDIMIAAGATTGTETFTVTPEDDEVDERDEVLDIAGTSDLPVTATSVTLADDEQTSTEILLSAIPSTVSEGAGATPVEVTATLDAGARTVSTTVTVKVTGSGDPDAVDFASVQDFTIMIAAGTTSGRGTFTLTPEDDNVAESSETLTVDGSSDLPVTKTSVTLTDDDVASSGIVLSASPSLVSEDGGAVGVRVTASLNGAVRQAATTVTVSVAGSGNPRAVNFQAVADFAITIAANAANGTGTFTLTPVDDGTAEADETLTVSGVSDLPVTSTTVTLADDDDPSTRILLSAVPGRVSEGAGATPVTVTATLDRGLRQQATQITVTVSGSGDPGAVDFAAVADFTITIPANAASGEGRFTLTPEDDSTVEADETLTMSGASDLPVTSAAVTLADDDEESTRILLSAVPGRVSEGDGATPVTVTATLDRGLRQQATQVTVTVSGSGDPDAADFVAVADFTITIPANAASGTGTFTLTPEDDATVEADEQLTISGTSALPVTPAAMTLADDDEVSTRILLFLTVDPPRASEGDGEIRVTVTAAVDKGVRPDETRIGVSVLGSGDPNAVDFAPIPDLEIVIPANAPNGTATFTVVPEDDRIVEADEVLTVSGVSDLPVRPATMELLDDDEASMRILLSADPARVSEGGGPVAVTVTASLDRGLRQEATNVTVSVSGSGNPHAVDFAAVADFAITIEANVPSGTGIFTLMPEDDAEDEADETLALTGESDLPVTPASVVLADDDEMASRVLSIADAEAAESAGDMAFAVTLDGPSPAEVTVSYATADPAGTVDPVAGAGVDYESASGTLTFAPGEVSRTIRVSVLDDELDEPDETFALVLADPRGATLGRGSALGTIRDDDEPPALSIAGDTGPEDVGELVFSVTLMARAPTEVTVNYATMDDTAVAGEDYGSVEGTLTFAPGETAKTIRVAVVDDAVDEADEESFAVALSAPTGATLDAATATGTIRDDDEPPALSVADAAGDEDVGALEFAVALSAPSGIEVSASYATADGTATAGGDYAAASGTLMFAPGEVSQTIRVAILDDALHEADEETFALSLSAPTGATLDAATATGTIRDDDEPPAVSVADAAGDEDIGALEFAVSLSGPSGIEVSASYATKDGTAAAGSDYAAASGTLMFAPGEVSQTIRVAILDDALHEADEETFALSLSAPTGATLDAATATGTIRDDDEPPAVSVADAAGDEDIGALEFAVSLSAPSGIEVSASYATKDGTAAAGSDYAAASGTLVFAPGEVSRTIRVAILDDALHEADEETFALSLSAPTGATLDAGTALGTIRDDDEPPALSVADAAGDEDIGALEFAVSLSAPSGIEVSASYATKDGTAAAGSDYAAASGTLMFAPGEVSQTIRVAILDDALHEADEETFELSLSAPTGATLDAGTALGTIRDDDEPPALSVADAAGDEDIGALEFAVSLSAPSGIEVSASYATKDGTAAAGGDYAAASGTLVFAPGEVSQTIRVAILDDALHEADEETFALSLSAPTGATLDAGTALGTIRDDDEPPALSVADAAGDEDIGALEFEVTLSAPSGIEVSASYATKDGTAAAGSDYAAASGTLVFAPGEVSQTIRVAILDDALDEADEETFALSLSAPTGATLDAGTALGTIRDDDEPPALSVADAAGDEDIGALEFAVSLSGPSGIEVSFSYATADDTATAGSDYAAASGTLMFAPGEVSQTIRVAILDDALDEADEETFDLSLSALRNATAADVSATGTIRDNDLAPPAIAGDLPAALLCVGGAPYELDLAGYFAGEELRFSAVSSTPLVATATLAGSRLTVAPASEGESSVTVTATNDAGSVSASLGVRVVTDPAELEAVESVLASIGRAVLTGVTDSVRARFGPRSAIGEQSASTSVQRGRTQVVPGASAVLGNQWPGSPMHGTRSGGWDGSGFFEPQVSGDDWFETTNRTYRRGMVPFSFSLDSAQSVSTGPAWAVWGRADAHRFESGIDGSSHDGTLTAVHLGADARVGDWLAGVSVARSAADADYRFERSVDACGGVGVGVGEGMVDAELTSVHPYVGRQIGRGSVWATLGGGGGEVSVERCETGRRNEADLSMRLGALGGRHPFAGGERIEISVVEEIGVLDLTTGDAVGPVGDRSVRVGQARLGLEASGVAPAGCDCSLTTFVRAFARGDWGDGATGTGLELAAGVRFRNLPRRLGIDAGIRALAAHSAEDASEQSANLTFSILPKSDGTGWRASLAWRRGARNAGLDTMNGIAPWTAASGSLPGARRDWIAESRLGYGIALRRGSVTPFVELDAGHSGRGGARFGVRHEFGDRVRGLVVEWGIEQHRFFAGVENRIVLEALGRF